MSDKKKMQLGMNPSTAAGRLVKDLLWSFIVETAQDKCCKCGEPMSRETFSIEHITPWLDSDDPVGLYFDLGNISYSHLRCNIADRRDNRVVSHGTETMYDKYGCRCEPCKEIKSLRRKTYYTPSKRKERYLRTGR